MPRAIHKLTDSHLLLIVAPLIALAAVIVHHMGFISTYAVNIPFQDDIYDFMLAVNLADTADGLWATLSELFRQYNDHRTVASRLQVYTAYLLQGEVNFRTLTLLANITLLLILFLYYLALRENKFRWVGLLIAALLLLHLRASTIVLWSQPAYAYYYVFFYAFACLFALHKVTPTRLILGALFCTLSMLTYASGQVVWLLGLASLLHQSLILKSRPITYAIIWLIAAMALLLLWRIGFEDVSTAKPLLRTLPDQIIDAPLPEALARYAAFFLTILGSAFTTSSTLVAGSIGAAILALLSYITLRHYQHSDMRLVLSCWFVIGSAAAVTLGRALWLAPDYVLASRYSFLSVILVSTLYVLLQTRFKLLNSAFVYLCVPIALLYSLWTYSHFSQPIQDSLDGRFQRFNAERYEVFSKPGAESQNIVTDAISAGRYHPPCRPYPECGVTR